MIILGIDPGTAALGYGLIQGDKDNLKLIKYGCVKTESKQAMPFRLHIIHKEIKKLMQKYKPDQLAVEEIFFAKNSKTALKVGQARGVILLLGAEHRIPVFDYTPLQVKQSVTAYGRADKQQVQKMVQAILKLKEIPEPDDAADALAVAICHMFQVPGNR
ncbi:crossover junction endodeoxyribonuclease RuvC [Patescibacteria group bacterium]